MNAIIRDKKDPNIDNMQLIKKKYFLTEIDSQKMIEIEKLPYVKFYENFYSDTEGVNLEKFYHNHLIVELIGLKHIPLCETYEGFEMLNHFCSENWIKFLNDMLTFKLNPYISEYSLSNKSLF